MTGIATNLPLNSTAITLPMSSHIEIPKGTTIMTGALYRVPRELVVTKAKTVIMAELAWIDIRNFTDETKDLVKDYLVEQKNSYWECPVVALAYWCSSGIGKWALIKDVKLVDAPIRKVPAERKDTGPTLRQLMQPGTKWELTVEAQVMKSSVHRELELSHILPVGTVVEIKSFQTYGPGYANSGIWAETIVNGKITLIEFKQLNQNPKALSAQEVVKVYGIRDTITGLLLSETPYNNNFNLPGYEAEHGIIHNIHTTEAGRIFNLYGNNVLDQSRIDEWQKVNDTYYASCRALDLKYRDELLALNSNSLVYSDKFTKMRKWKRPQDVKGWILEQSGYYAGMEIHGEYDGIRGGGKVFDIPKTWEFVTYDKLTKTLVDTSEIQTWLADTWRLRDLTVKYGSAVRAIYKDLEKKDKLAEFSTMIVFSCDEGERDRYYRDGLTDSEKNEVRDALSVFAKGDIKRGGGKNEYAVAVKNEDEAIMVRLSYSGSLKLTVLNLQTLTEVLDTSTQ